jgi:outer membrane protein assembly factor BamB
MARGDAPLAWSDAKNIAWKIPIPGRGHSSPVLWGDKLFLTTAVPLSEIVQGDRRGPGGGTGVGIEHKFVVMCLDRRTGKVIWERVVKTAKPHEGYHFKYGSFASNSPVTDGKHLIAFFGSRGVYCFDLDGKPIWQKEFVAMRMRLGFGEGTAPTLHGDRLFLNFDQESDSFLVALNKNDGKELWKVARDEPSSWAQPLVVEHGGSRQVIVSATNKVRSYDYESGKLILECAGLGSNVIPATVTANGIVYVMSGHRDPNLLAIKLGRTGDLTGTDSILWTNTRGNSYTASPVLFENKLYMVTDNGFVSCLDAVTGKPFYQQQRLPKPYNFKSSPVGAGGKLYLATENGDVVVLKMGEQFEVLSTNTMADQIFIATPAIADGRIFLRSQETLYCIRP